MIVKITGDLKLVTGEPVTDKKALIRSTETRAQENGVVVDKVSYVDITQGIISFDTVPGKGVILLLDDQNRVNRTITYLVGDKKDTLSLYEAVKAAEIADEDHKTSLDYMAADLLATYNDVVKEANRAEAAADKAQAMSGEIIPFEKLAADVQAKLNGGHKHVIADITDLPTISSTATGNSIARRDANGCLVVGEPETTTQAATKNYVDTAIKNSTSIAHTHKIADITGLQNELNNKASEYHAHNISDITNLQSQLNSKASVNHTHTTDSLTDVNGATFLIGSSINSNSLIVANANGQITSVSDPLSIYELTRKDYVDRTVSSRSVAIKGTVKSGKENTNTNTYRTESLSVVGTNNTDWVTVSSNVIKITKQGIYQIHLQGQSNITYDFGIPVITMNYTTPGYSRSATLYSTSAYIPTDVIGNWGNYSLQKASMILSCNTAELYVGVATFKNIADIYVTIEKMD